MNEGMVPDRARTNIFQDDFNVGWLVIGTLGAGGHYTGTRLCAYTKKAGVVRKLEE